MFVTLKFISRGRFCPTLRFRHFFMSAYELIFGAQPRIYVVMACISLLEEL